MKALLLTPHADDETLFAAYTAMAYRPLVVCVYNEGRTHELAAAVGYLGCQYHMLPLVEKGADEDAVALALTSPTIHSNEPEVVIAPAWREDGHEEHNAVSRAARNRYPDAEHIQFLTYAPRGQRDRDGDQVLPQDGFIARKLRALSCYQSQHANPGTRPWFFDLLDLREWVMIR